MADTSAFLQEVLGSDGAALLVKTMKRIGSIENALVPRTILAWVGIAGRLGHDGELPGLAGTFARIQKSEAGYSGEIKIEETSYQFADASTYQVASAVAVAIGYDTELSAGNSKELARLGKSIDLLVKSRLANAVLQKRMLDPNLGYKLQHQHEEFNIGGQIHKRTVVTAHAPNGNQVGEAEFVHHNDGSMESMSTDVHPAHQRLGLASAMYAHAEKITGAKITPSENRSPAGKALWAGNAAQQQFGKTELPGMTAMPEKPAGPQEAQAPSRQQAAAPVKSRIPKITRTPAVPKTQPLHMSEKQLHAKCKACGGGMMKNEAFTNCLCWRSMAATLTKSNGAYVLNFSSDWDAESVAAFVDSIKADK